MKHPIRIKFTILANGWKTNSLLNALYIFIPFGWNTNNYYIKNHISNKLVSHCSTTGTHWKKFINWKEFRITRHAQFVIWFFSFSQRLINYYSIFIQTTILDYSTCSKKDLISNNNRKFTHLIRKINYWPTIALLYCAVNFLSSDFLH